MWGAYELPTEAKIGGKTYEMRTDFRVALDIFAALNDPNLTKSESIVSAFEIFYPAYAEIADVHAAVNIMVHFLNGNKSDDGKPQKYQLIDWEQDLNIIIPPINRILGQEIRQMPYLHWWTFLGAFMEIGECTFNTFVGIRNKKAKGKKLDAQEQEIYKENRTKIDIKDKLDSGTQKLLDEVMGKT